VVRHKFISGAGKYMLTKAEWRKQPLERRN